MSKDYDPMDYYEEFSEWLIKYKLVANKDDLVEKFEDGFTFEEFLEYRAAGIPE